MSWEYGVLLMLGMFAVAGIGANIWLYFYRRRIRQSRQHSPKN